MGKRTNKKARKLIKKQQNNKMQEKDVLEPPKDSYVEEMVHSEDESMGLSKEDSSVERILKIIALLSGEGVFASLLQSLINKFIQTSYQNNCQNFYNIPYKYFCIDVGREVLVVVLTILMLVLVLGCGHFMRKDKQKDKLMRAYYIFTEICMGFVFVQIVFWAFLGILKYITIQNIDLPNWLIDLSNKYAVPITAIIFIAAMLTVFGFNNNKTLRKIKNEIIKNIFMGIVFAAIMICLTIVTAAQVLCIQSDVKNKYRYETVKIDNKDFAVLSEKDGMFLVAEYGDYNGEKIIFTKEYRMIDCKDMEIVYEEWEVVPTINTQKRKQEYVDNSREISMK